MKRYVVFMLVCIVGAASQATALPYGADEVILLPPPNPDHTNTASGRVVPVENDPYVIMVENEFKLENWKEWIITYNITILNPNDWFADLHVDYSHLVSENPQEWENDVCGTATAIWNTYYGSQASPAPLTWTVVGYPGQIQPLKVDPSQADDWIDTNPFDYNPEWVSLHFEGYNVEIDYEFTDWCIPEPASLSLLGLGLAALIRRRR